jgi:glucose dehydrogenase
VPRDGVLPRRLRGEAAENGDRNGAWLAARTTGFGLDPLLFPPRSDGCEGWTWSTPYAARREVLLSPLGLPCNPPPGGTLAAVDMNAGTIKWQVPLGLSPYGGFIKGVPSLGGPILTAGGLVFIAAAMDNHIRAFDVESGVEVEIGSVTSPACQSEAAMIARSYHQRAIF